MVGFLAGGVLVSAPKRRQRIKHKFLALIAVLEKFCCIKLWSLQTVSMGTPTSPDTLNLPYTTNPSGFSKR